MDVVVVESPAKAKTINKYLGDGYVVLASYGHVRDLPSKNGSVRPDDDFAMTYETDSKAAKPLKAISDALKTADRLYLATDPDREGEAISWHVLQALRERKAMRDIDVKRVVFNEITKGAVLDAMAHPRDLDMNLVNAQQARRALDYLVGFTLSPVLWRKLPGARSAGRVQSVALRLICERELEIEAFEAREYWSIEVDFLTAGGAKITARLTHIDGRKLGKYDLPDEQTARRAAERIAAEQFAVAEVATKPTRRNPPPPFTTSTLQQEASRKLGFGARRTMDLAQRLYEGITLKGETVGLITYMRTDGVQMAGEALDAIRGVIRNEFGAGFAPATPRIYKTKAKNAQEAHEAIRPTDPRRVPDVLGRALPEDQLRLYDLIWKRAVASQMESATLERTTIDIASADGALVLRATGSVVVFPGFFKLYQEGRDDPGEDENGDVRLPKVAKGDRLNRDAVRPAQHFTEPPPRYSEASLVAKLEELGIGRPSTYAQILSVLQERDYARLDKKRFIPEDKGRLVTAFLSSFFGRYVGYDFTAELEERLDDITDSKIDWKQVLRDFWQDFSHAVDETKDLRVSHVLDALNELLGPHIFPAKPGETGDPRDCPTCDDGRLSLKLGRYGAFIGCSNYPDCKFTRRIGEETNGIAENGPSELGTDPESGLPVTIRRGPYGIYLQLGEAVEKGDKPKRSSIPKDIDPTEVDLALALKMLSLPRVVGQHPESGEPIEAGLGRFGPYVRSDGKYARVASTEEMLTVGLNRAVTLLAESKSRGGGRGRTAKPLRMLGAHPDDEADINVMKGRYGPYVTHGGVNATLPNGVEPEEVTLEQAIELLRAKAAKGKPKKKAAKKKTTKAKTAAKPKARAKAKAKPKSKAGKASTAKSKPKDSKSKDSKPKDGGKDPSVAAE